MPQSAQRRSCAGTSSHSSTTGRPGRCSRGGVGEPGSRPRFRRGRTAASSLAAGSGAGVCPAAVSAADGSSPPAGVASLLRPNSARCRFANWACSPASRSCASLQVGLRSLQVGLRSVECALELLTASARGPPPDWLSFLAGLRPAHNDRADRPIPRWQGCRGKVKCSADIFLLAHPALPDALHPLHRRRPVAPPATPELLCLSVAVADEIRFACLCATLVVLRQSLTVAPRNLNAYDREAVCVSLPRCIAPPEAAQDF